MGGGGGEIPKLSTHICLLLSFVALFFSRLGNNNNNGHLSCAHQRPERSYDTLFSL